jgi:hypothetical protein
MNSGVRIICHEGTSVGARILSGEKELIGVSAVDIRIRPQDLVRAFVTLCIESADVAANARFVTLDGKAIRSITFEDGTTIESET